MQEMANDMLINKPSLVLIDLDGTLVDSVPDLAFCIDGMMEQVGLPPHGEAKVRNWVGNGVDKLVKRALVGQLEGEPDQKLLARAHPIFMSLYDRHNGERSQLYPSVVDGLNYLQSRGHTLACITNKAKQFTEPLLRAMGIRERFALVISGDTLARKKPDPLPLLHAAEVFEVAPGSALMIGDSVNDVTAARAAGFKVVCVSYGYNHGLDIREANPDGVVDSFSELNTLL